MNAKELKDFIESNTPETRYEENSCYIWIHYMDLKEWAELIESMVEECGHDCTLMSDGSVWFDLQEIADWYGVNVDEVLDKD